MDRTYLAIDLGAESGRVVAGRFDGGRLALEEIHRFPNGAIEDDGRLHWDADGLWQQILEGLAAAADRFGAQVASIGVDTWGVDYALLDDAGNVLGQPFHYRDARTDGMQEAVFGVVPRAQVYRATGIQFLPFNTLYQLYAEAQSGSPSLERARHLLFMPDLFNYRLTGRMANEYTDASTSQFVDPWSRDWAGDLLEKLDLPADLLKEIVQPGSALGRLTDQVRAATGLGPVPVIAVGGHDTASAVAAVPAQDGAPWAYLSSGTWSLMGVEISEPIVTDEGLAFGMTNEGGVCGTIRLLKNISGLWLVQECRRTWADAGQPLDYAQLTQVAEQAEAFTRIIDPDDPRFTAPGDMPKRINRFLQEKQQPASLDKGQIIRTILESLALRYRAVLEQLERMTDRRVDVIHIVGGGSRNALLNRFTADATQRTVIAGPVEATCAGNILLQMLAGGGVASLAEGRRIVRDSFETEIYEPGPPDDWNQRYGLFQELTTSAP